MKFLNTESDYGFVFEDKADFWIFLHYFKTEKIPYYMTLTFEYLDPPVKMDFEDLEFLDD